MERVDVILAHNVEYTGSVSRLPISVSELRSFGDLISLSSSERRKSRIRSFADLGVQIEISVM